jgi:hypothetical protein
VALALLLAAAAAGQLPVPPGTDLFGDAIVEKLPRISRPSGAAPRLTEDEEKAARVKAEGYSQTLIFQNDRQIRGEIVSLGKDEILWRRPDASAPIRLSRGDVRRILFAPDAPLRDPRLSLTAAGSD